MNIMYCDLDAKENNHFVHVNSATNIGWVGDDILRNEWSERNDD